MGKHKKNLNKRRSGVALALVLGGVAHLNASGSNLVPLPEDIFDSSHEPNPILDVTNRVVSGLGSSAPQVPDQLQIQNESGSVTFDNEKNIFRYEGSKQSPIRLRTDSGSDILTPAIEAKLDSSDAVLEGPVTIYQDEVMVRGEDGGFYNWKDKRTAVNKVRLKVNGLMVRGSRIEYNTDADGKEYITVHDAYVTTEDVQRPSAWIGTGTLTIYPGDYGKVSRLSVAVGDSDITVPVLGWFTFSHSLNPREGYLPGIGSRSHWGTYLENSYGILFGNRRVDGIMPTADYLATLHLDARTRRGLAGGLDLEDIVMTRSHKDMKGFTFYYADDTNPMINPLDGERLPTKRERYRIALQSMWDVTPAEDTKSDWKLVTNVNVVSDRYMLRDFLPEVSRTDDKPDNTVRLTRRTDSSQSMIFTRFAPNDYYVTDERVQASYYRVRSAIGNTGLNYETNNSACIMRQYLPTEQRLEYERQLSNLKDSDLKEYYSRLLNTESYFRVNTTHELTTSLTVLRFLNVTPKTGAAYTGYYDVGGIGSDNRLLGYLGCDINMKFHNHYPNFRFKPYGMDGLSHLIQPYASYSQGQISSSNEYVPQVDTWSGTRSGSSTNPVPMDLCGFTGIDGWGNWNICRFGIKNTFTTRVDGERLRFLTWNTFVDYNKDNPNTSHKFSNLYNVISFKPSRRLELYATTQTPTIDKGEEYKQYSLGLRLIPSAWLETYMAYYNIEDHPTQKDSGQYQLRANLRLNEKYTISGQWYYEIEEGRMPIQQYSVFRHAGAWYIGATFFMRDNGGKKEEGFGISFTLGETGTALPISLF